MPLPHMDEAHFADIMEVLLQKRKQ